MPTPLTNCIIVLQRPREVVNIGATVRAMKNMGLTQLRLIAPPPFTRDQITAVAHRGEDILDRLSTYPTLDSALADAILVVGTSARPHTGRKVQPDLRSVAPTILAHATVGPVAILFGPEDNGLDNATLDRCQQIIAIPTNPDYTSLNLAQAALLIMYELRMAATKPLPTPPAHTPADAAQLEHLFTTTQAALHALDFFKSPATITSTMRTLREIIQRARLDTRELALVQAIMREVQRVGGRRTNK